MYIAIPTYKRHDILERKTLSTLERGGISPSQIFIFVANEAEKKLYEAIPSTKYHKIIVGKLGITNQRIFIKHYFPEGSYVVSIDDDIEGVYQLAGNSMKEIKVKPFFEKALKELKKEKKFMWGIYPAFNVYFMKLVKKKSTGLSFIIGALHGYIVRYDKSLEPNTLSEGKEDYEQSILYYLKDGGVLRFNNVSIKTNFLAKGGLGENRVERNKKSAKYLQRTYPKLVSIFHRINGMTEIRLTRKNIKANTSIDL
jgi:hypothetical protein